MKYGTLLRVGCQNHGIVWFLPALYYDAVGVFRDATLSPEYGSDLERRIECIEAVVKVGLRG